MPTYEIHFTQTASATTKVEADSLEEAIDKAYSAEQPSLCAQCSGWGQPGIDLSGDWELDETSYFKDGEYIEGMEEEA